MKINKSIIQQIANGETSLTGETVRVSITISNNGLYSKFSQYAFFYDGFNDEIGDIQDCILDFNMFGSEIRMKVDTDIHPTGVYQIFGMTPDLSLKNLFNQVLDMPYDVSERLENCVFSIRGVKGTFSYISTYFYYCFAKGRISEAELLEMIRMS